ncbi:ATP-dependent zinc metalloprotease FtsH 4 [Rubripirellula lacrimiformis]|uniref:ATP-dependent zinc metalloprotease FtsH 4 n=1 Tax=Rubripirellula lacrimiformis TaxID=1930273 RepID=A0A517ND80_9BACT|nr:ATP-binding protein [Rubripirellula lacrimiformis]QDT05092.1 ATP-dependent zinc metalloprotease FtsH 4 [Rubripirellula lacrimiformis]
MNAELLKRIMRAIADGSQDDLEQLAAKVIDRERESGHSRLANQLEGIMSRPRPQTEPASGGGGTSRKLSQLPVSRRHQELLATLVPREELEHHMVLPTEIENRFARIEQEYAARERLGAYGLKNRKTILLYGPPGCGKSLGAKRLAWNTGLPLLKVRFDALLSSYFGESASNLRAVFDSAKEQPCVLLLDECDFIAKSRSNSRDIGEASRIVNSLLQLMEEYDAPGLLVATTNLENSLDDALFRRFDDVFQIPLPGQSEIDALLRATLSAVQCDAKLSWQKAVKNLDGSSAAMAVKSARDAAKAAVLSGVKIVDTQILLAAIDENKRADQQR